MIKNKNAQINVPAKRKVHVTRKLSNARAKKDGLVMTAAKKHAQKIVMAMANANPMVYACADNVEDLDVKIGGVACLELEVENEGELKCVIPPGRGNQEIEVIVGSVSSKQGGGK